MNLPSLKDAPAKEQNSLFISKLKSCENSLDFSNPRAQFMQKEAKRRQLVDITEYVNSRAHVFNSHTYEPFMQMVHANILRALPRNAPPELLVDAEDDEPFFEPSWPHLQLVYELLRKYIISEDTDNNEARRAISVNFVSGMVDLFHSEDPRERDYLKTIVHRMYGKWMPLRIHIRQAMIDLFHRVVYDNERSNGVCELLEILGSIIHGFAVPLKDEHRELLTTGLLPLHLPASMPSYHVQLSFCVVQYAEKEAELGKDIIKMILRHWPMRSSRKEVLLLSEMEEVIEMSGDVLQAEPIVGSVFRRLGRCIESPQFQVAERALFFWNNDTVADLFALHRDDVMPIIVGSLLKNTASHWNRNVLLLSENVTMTLREMDVDLFERARLEHERSKVNVVREEAERMLRWRTVYAMARERSGRRYGGDGRERMVTAVEDVGVAAAAAVEREYAPYAFKLTESNSDEERGSV